MHGEAHKFMENLDSPLPQRYAMSLGRLLSVDLDSLMSQLDLRCLCKFSYNNAHTEDPGPGLLVWQWHVQLDIIRECWLCNLSLVYCKTFAQIFIALYCLYCCKVLSWKYIFTTNTELEVDIWGYQFAFKKPNQGIVKVKPLWREKEAVRGVLRAPVSPRGLLLSPYEVGKFYTVFPHPRNCLSK